MLRYRVVAALVAACVTLPLAAQPRTVTGKVTREPGIGLQGVTVSVRGTAAAVQTNGNGDYTIRAETGQVLLYRLIGYLPQERVVSSAGPMNVVLEKSATSLDAMVVTAHGQQAVVRSLGVAQQTVQGSDVAQTGRENFINALAGRIAGVEVTSSSGVPGSSSSITIRGVSSISGSNQPLMVIDGLPMDNKTLNTGQLASDRPGSTTAFSNRGLDFANRASDINPEDIESITVLKGPEAAALYGIDAANGAIVITTKRGQAGSGGLVYQNSFRVDRTRARPEIQRVYGPTTVAGDLLGSFFYFGAPYAAGTQFFDNIDQFFQTGISQSHNLTFSGATTDNRINYRVGVAGVQQGSVVPTADYRRINLTGATQAQVSSWLKTDLSMNYALMDNNQPLKGDGGPLVGLLIWPQTDNAADFLTPAGTRRRITTLAQNGEVDNPYFSVNKNQVNAQNSRLIANLSLTVTPFRWGYVKTTLGSDSYTNDNLIVRHPETAGAGTNNNGTLDLATDLVRNLNAITLFNVNRQKVTSSLSVSGFLGHQVTVNRSQTNALLAQDFLDPNFVSINNANLRFNRTTIAERRLVSAFGQLSLAWKDWLFVNATGRNDWTSTIPVERNSFFYPSIQSSLIFSDAIPAIGKVMTGKLRASYAEVGRDARPYAFRPALEFKTTSNGGYGYGFTGPNLGLKPEFKTSTEFGTELGFLDNRLGLDITVYRAQTRDQIVNDIRGSYGTGFILFNLNGAVTRNEGLEIVARATPVSRRDFGWDLTANFERARATVLSLPNALPESYVSDTWLYGNVRNGTAPGRSTRSLTGFFYLRNSAGELLIDPTTGLPIRSTTFIDAGYDRQPNFLLGVTNTLRWKRASLTFLWDFRRGGDVFNATEHFLTTRGLAMRTLDREQPRVIDGVLRDGRENTATPTRNTIVVTPAVQPLFYTGISEELFIERDINWVRLRDVTLRVGIPGRWLRGRDASVFVTGTDLLLFTNYSGLDPIVNGNTAAVGGSGAAGVDFGNFPMPRGFAMGLKVGY
jgi:TonB-linked SusC/RagA family outer membrane protein